jgi:hypothetical protein
MTQKELHKGLKINQLLIHDTAWRNLKMKRSLVPGLTPEILATQEAEIRSIEV